MSDDAMNLGEVRENDDRKARLAELILSGEAIAFIGAGISRKAEYPNWRDFLDELARGAAGLTPPFIPVENLPKEEYLRYAESIKQHVRNLGYLVSHYDTPIAHTFSPNAGNNFGDFHTDLVRLPFRAYITTNYDDLIERALNEVHKGVSTNKAIVLGREKVHLRPFFDSLISHEGAPYVVHIHGIYDDSSTIVLAESEYQEKYGIVLATPNENSSQPDAVKPLPIDQYRKIAIHHQFLWSLIASRRLVFIGFSVDDPYLLAMLKAVAFESLAYRQEVHYVILPLPKEKSEAKAVRADAQKLWASYGIVAVFYEKADSGDKHLALDRLVGDILAEHQKRKNGVPEPTGETHSPKTLPYIERSANVPKMDTAQMILAASQDMRKRARWI